jgi:hypothetical protein
MTLKSCAKELDLDEEEAELLIQLSETRTRQVMALTALWW